MLSNNYAQIIPNYGALQQCLKLSNPTTMLLKSTAVLFTPSPHQNREGNKRGVKTDHSPTAGLLGE